TPAGGSRTVPRARRDPRRPRRARDHSWPGHPRREPAVPPALRALDGHAGGAVRRRRRLRRRRHGGHGAGAHVMTAAAAPTAVRAPLLVVLGSPSRLFASLDRDGAARPVVLLLLAVLPLAPLLTGVVASDAL